MGGREGWRREGRENENNGTNKERLLQALRSYTLIDLPRVSGEKRRRM
jgi:hypothetical protein